MIQSAGHQAAPVTSSEGKEEPVCQEVGEQAATPPPYERPAEQPPLTESADGAVVFVDLQNLHNFLGDQCGVNPYQFNMVDFLKEWGASYGIPVAEIRVYTGIHSDLREPEKAAATTKRLNWLARQGVKVFTSKLAYAVDHTTGLTRAREKGVDVRLASELIQAVACEGVSRVILITQDNDLSQAVDVARSICRSRGVRLQAFSPELKDRSRASGKMRCGFRGIHMTDKLDVPIYLVDKHSTDRRLVRRDPADSAGPIAHLVAQRRDEQPEIVASDLLPPEATPSMDRNRLIELGLLVPSRSTTQGHRGQAEASTAMSARPPNTDPLIDEVELAVRQAVEEAVLQVREVVAAEPAARRGMRP